MHRLEEVWLAPPPKRSFWQEYGRNGVLFALTALSVYGAGWIHYGATSATFAVAVLSILLAHEMGHYLACRAYGIDCTLPFFVPSPWIPAGTWLVWLPVSFVGTFGAVIRIRSAFPNRRALFDVGIAGPLAGFFVLLPVLALGVLDSRVVTEPAPPEAISFGEPLAFWLAARAVHGPIPEEATLVVGPLGMAAWFGLLVTALNLMPIGQLDGGHVAYALLRRHAFRLSQAALAGCLVLVWLRPTWLFWGLLLLIVGRRHPPTGDDLAPMGRGRWLVGALGVLVFALSFTPSPVLISWSDLAASLPW